MAMIRASSSSQKKEGVCGRIRHIVRGSNPPSPNQHRQSTPQSSDHLRFLKTLFPLKSQTNSKPDYASLQVSSSLRAAAEGGEFMVFEVYELSVKHGVQ